ncbi:MAG TPA: hypothetical protein VKH35_08630 [Thermoanaerobaculia bacterium]|nr:hypothetical protein [Thermoanaerobaculia bacterium]
MNGPRTDLRVALFLAATVTLLFADVLFLGSSFYLRDLYLYHFPMKEIVRQTLLRGEFPWWQRLLADGQPMAANPAWEIFYPPQWLILIGPFPFGFALHIVAHVYLAVLGAYACFRAVPLRVGAALFGAISFGLGGFLLGSVTNLPTFFVWSWAGVIGWAVLRAARTGRIGAAAVSMAMPLLVAEPMAVAQLLLLIAVGAFVLLRRPGAHPGALALAIVLAFGIAAVQLVPAIGYAASSARARGFRYDVVTDFSMPPQRPVELITPRALRLAALYPRGAPYLPSIYCGLGVVLFALAGVATRQRGGALLLAICACSYLLALGGGTPLFRWLYDAGLRSIRYPEKFIAMGVVALVAFAAFTFDRLLAGDANVARAAMIAGGAVALLLPIFAGRAAVFPTAMALCWAGIAAGALVQRGGAAWVLGAVALLVIDLAPLSIALLPRMPRAFFTPPRIARLLTGRTVFHRGEWTQPELAMRYAALSPAWDVRNALRPYSPANWGMPFVLAADIDETELLPTHELLDMMMRAGNAGIPHWGETFATLAGADTLLDYRPFAPTEPRQMQPLRIERIPSQGRYFFARALVPLRDFLGFIRVHDVRGVAFVASPTFVPAPATLEAVREGANAAVLDVNASGRAFLVATVTRYAGWHATLDGRPVPIVAANIAFQGIEVPPGRHRIELRDRDPLVFWGAGLTALALVIALTRRRPRPRNGS